MKLRKLLLALALLAACAPASSPLSQPGGGPGPGPPPVSAQDMSSALDAMCGTPVGQVWVRWTNAWGCSSALGFFDPIWWGADPTGVADSGAACTAAFAALPATGGTIRFTPGTYNFTTNCTIPITLGDGASIDVHMEGAQLSTATPNVHIFDRVPANQAQANTAVGLIVRFFGGVLGGNSTPAAPNGQIGINLGATYNGSTNGVYYQKLDIGLYCQFCLNFRSLHDRGFANSIYGIKIDQGQWTNGFANSSSTGATIDGFRDYGALPTGTWSANTLTSLVWATGGNVTATTTSPHGVQVGDYFTISGATPAGYNGNFVAAAGTTGNTLIYTMTGTVNPGAVTANGSLAAGAHFHQEAYIAVNASDGVTVNDFIGEGFNTINGIEFTTNAVTIVKSFNVTNYHAESTPANSFIKLSGAFGGNVRIERAIIETQSYFLDITNLPSGVIEINNTPYISAFVSPIFNIVPNGTTGNITWIFRNFGPGIAASDLTQPAWWSTLTSPSVIWNLTRNIAGTGVQEFCKFCFIGSSTNLPGFMNGVMAMGNIVFTTDDNWFLGNTTNGRPHSLYVGTGVLGTAGGIVSGGTRPTATGAGGTCAGASATGGALAGTITLTGACAAGNTLALTAMPLATTGYACNAHDRTTPAALVQQTGTTTTSATFTFAGTTTGATDVIVYGPCIGY